MKKLIQGQKRSNPKSFSVVKIKLMTTPCIYLVRLELELLPCAACRHICMGFI